MPHLTVGEAPIEIELELPIASFACAVTLIEEQATGQWNARAAFPLGRPTLA